MPRVYHVTFTKEFDATVLAESEKDLQRALDAEDIDTTWDTPHEWDITIRDTMQDTKRLPEKLPEFIAVAVAGVVYNASDQNEKIADIHQRAEEELTQRWLAMKQLSFPFEKP